MKKTVSVTVVCLAILMFAFVLAMNVNTAKAEADMTFLEYASYVDLYGWLHVIGEVQNNGTIPIRFVEIVATFYNSSDEMVGTDWTYTYVSIIDVGETSPFEIVLMEATQVPKVDHYTLTSNFYTTTEQNPNADLNILYHTTYFDSSGMLHIIGEVQNNGTVPLDYVQIIAAFYDSSDMIVGVDYTYTDVDVIHAGEKSPFEIYFSEETQIPKVDYYILTVDFDITTALMPALKMLSNSSYIDSYGWMHIIGEIENNGTATATYVQIVATLYDSEGNIVLTDYTFTNPTAIESGDKAPFEITVIDDDRVPLVATYSLNVQSNEYNLIPEWSAINMVLVTALMLAAAGLLGKVFFKKRKNPSKQIASASL